jgi:mono/diheme cytochrome c family protein
MKYAVALIAVLACFAGSALGQDVGDRSKGAAIAQQICAECHAVHRGERRSFNAEAPTFEAIATTPGMTSIALTAALRTSHRAMPNIILPDDDLKNIIAYILSLK